MRTINTARRRWMAAFPIAAAGLLLTAGALMPRGLDQPIRSIGTAQSELAAAASTSGRLSFCTGLIILGLGCLAVSFVAIATLCANGPGETLATVATGIAGLGCLSGVVVNSLVNLAVAGAAESQASAVDSAKVLLTTNTTTLSTIALVLYVAGLVIASVLMGIALWRARAVPRWLSVLFPVGLIAGSVSPQGAVGVLISLPFAVAMVLLARCIRQDGAGLRASDSSLRPSVAH
jgi:hypothetical protein